MQPENLPDKNSTLRERAATKIGWLAITRKNSPRRNRKQVLPVVAASVSAHPDQHEVAPDPQVVSKIQLISRQNRQAELSAEPTSHSEIFDAKYKNYQGRHNQETHTTLYNIAHPSQGRRGVQSRGTRSETLANTGRQAVTQQAIGQSNQGDALDVTPSIKPKTDAAYMREYDINAANSRNYNTEVARQVSLILDEKLTPNELFVRLQELHNSITGQIYPTDYFATLSPEQRLDVYRMRKESLDNKALVAQVFGTDAESAIARGNAVQWDALGRVLLKRDVEFATADKRILNMYIHKMDKTKIKNVVWDGAFGFTPNRNMPDGKPISPGPQTVAAIKAVAQEIGIPARMLIFNQTQVLNEDGLAYYNPSTGLISIEPKFVSRLKNDDLFIKASLVHEIMHHKYTTVSVAVRFVEKDGAKPKTSSSAAARADDADVQSLTKTFFTKETLQSIKSPDFLGTPYEQKFLQALTNPKSVIKIDPKTGFVTAKKGYEPFVALFKQDGVTRYSSLFWSRFATWPSQWALRTAITETLAEASSLISRGQQGKVPKEWLAAAQLMDSVFGKLGSPQNELDARGADTITLLDTSVNKELQNKPKPITPTGIPNIANTALKNYQGRHNQETHTTLYNIAHPSQGRAAGRNQARESRNALAGGNAGSANVMQRDSTQDLQLGALIPAMESNRYQENYDRRIASSLAHEEKIAAKIIEINDWLKKHSGDTDIILYAGIILERLGNNATDFVAQTEKQQLDMVKTELSRINESIALRSKAMGDWRKQGESQKFISMWEKQIEEMKSDYLHLTAVYRLMHKGEEHAAAAKKDGLWYDHKTEQTILKRVVWDGAIVSPESRGPIVGDTKVAPGKDTEQALKNLAKDLGIPDKIIIFTPVQRINAEGGEPWADFNPNTGLFTIYPKLINNPSNSLLQLKAVWNHEISHNRYEMVKHAVRYSVDAARASKTQGATSADRLFDKLMREADDNFMQQQVGPQITRDLRTKSFLGTNYERQLLIALTSPESIVKVSKNGLLSAKKGFEQFVDLLKTDGVTNYSVKFWRDFQILPSTASLQKAINETLAEVAYTVTVGQADKIPPRWLGAYEAFESFFGKLGSPYLQVPTFHSVNSDPPEEFP